MSAEQEIARIRAQIAKLEAEIEALSEINEEQNLQSAASPRKGNDDDERN